jgi:tetratricopeptide (TPR) repeat protein
MVGLGQLNNVLDTHKATASVSKKSDKQVSGGKHAKLASAPSPTAGPVIVYSEAQITLDCQVLESAVKAHNAGRVQVLLGVYAKKGIEYLFSLAEKVLEGGNARLSAHIYRMLISIAQDKYELNYSELYCLAKAYEKFGQYKDAIRAYNDALGETPRGVSLALRRARLKSENLPEYDKLQIQTNLAGLYLTLKMYSECLALTKRILEKDPNNTDAWFFQYLAAKDSGKTELVRNCLIVIEDLAAKSQTEDGSVIPFTKEPMALFNYAQIQLDQCNDSAAEVFFKYLFECGDRETKKATIIYLMSVYQNAQDLEKLEALAKVADESGFEYESCAINASVAMSRSVLPENLKDPEKRAKLEEKAHKLQERCFDLKKEELYAFPNVFNLIGHLLHVLNIDNVMDEGIVYYLDRALGDIPKEAKELQLDVSRHMLRVSMHKAAALLEPQQYGNTEVEYLPLNEFPGASSANNVASWRIFFYQDLLSAPDPSEKPYSVKDHDQLLMLIKEQLLRNPKYGQVNLEQLSPSEAIRLAGDVAMDIVREYKESPRADETCTPLEEKIIKGDFDQAVCRNYSMLFIAVFNELKSQSPWLGNYFAISDYSRGHTFPSVVTFWNTNQGAKLVFTSVDPTSGDQPGGVLETDLRNFGFEREIYYLMASRKYTQAWNVCWSQYQANSGNVMVQLDLVFRMFEVLRQDPKALPGQFERLIKIIGDIEDVLSKDSTSLNVRSSLSYIKAELLFTSGKYSEAKPLLDNLLGDLDSPKEYKEGIIRLISLNSEMLGDDAGVKQVADQLFEEKKDVSITADIKGGRIVSPLFKYFPAKSRVFVVIDNKPVPAAINNGAIDLPKALIRYRKQAEGKTISVVVPAPKN